ncbi:hypothetical protein B6N60_01201 [Richelia sinica FACHB-800]|uniref:DUF4435 domain-containing protein n=1 Tax=Richelia sinica FACHB-800 TaxID=1357546 RepID=A0A975T5E9_9NOST|nr:hypothetical protein [Richelia sinica]MBD2664257.1 hypothetical protein [Richelia sinica FACHB-800]QXE22518.1 hypothetical protein B6N60_01201 [Richelia sinica FACHB-800]
MQVLDNFLYILIEGEPESPEVAFINRVISNLINQELLSKINYKVQEIGGSGNFNAIGKLIYSKSNLHQTLPIIAISDRDFRTQEKINEMALRTDNDFIQKNSKSVKIIYWSRHEWENFLLEETEIIANLLNQIPTTRSESKPFRKNVTNSLTKAQLDEWLIQYFQASIMQELLECLRFRFREKTNLRLSLDKPTSLSLPNMEIWFRNQIFIKAKESRRNIFSLKPLLQNKLQENFWQSYINNPQTLDFHQAKIFFRGKEALKSLCKRAIQYLSIENLSDDKFCKELLLPELEKNKNSLIVQQLGVMLKPYFQQAANLTGI